MTIDELELLIMKREKDGLWVGVIFKDRGSPPLACEFAESEGEIRDWFQRMKTTKPWETKLN